MQKVFFSFSLLIVFSAFAKTTMSDTTIHVLTKEHYFKKSKNQKTAGWLLFRGGAGLLTIGSVITLSNISEDPIGEAFTIGAGDIIGGIGSLAMLGSIPL